MSETPDAPVGNGDSFFNDLDDVELGVKDGKYPAYIVRSEIVTKKDDTKAWVLTYRISDGPSKGEQVAEWFNSYPNDPAKAANAKKWRARRLESLGVPESQWSKFTPVDAVGIFGIIGVKNSGGYTNISSFVVAQEGTNVMSPPATPFAQPQADVSELM